MSEEMPQDPFDNPDEPSTGFLTTPQIGKRLVWDIAPCNLAAEVAKQMGMNPASSDVEDMEHRQAHGRLALVANALGPVLMMMSDQASKTVLASLEVANGIKNVVTEEQQAQMHNVIYQTSLGILAELRDVGFIALNPMVGYTHNE